MVGGFGAITLALWGFWSENGRSREENESLIGLGSSNKKQKKAYMIEQGRQGSFTGVLLVQYHYPTFSNLIVVDYPTAILST